MTHRRIRADHPSRRRRGRSRRGSAGPERGGAGTRARGRLPEDDDVLELTERVEPEPEPEPESILEPASHHSIGGDLDVVAPATARASGARLYPSGRPGRRRRGPGLPFSFGHLARTVLMPAEGHTLEDVVREMLKPLLKDWLDRNLPGIVEAQVQAEVERISRRRV